MKINKLIKRTKSKNISNFKTDVKLYKISNDVYKNELPLVSVVCNTYNHSNYIKMCLDSILEQNVNFNVEILIHDDASNDGTSSIIEEYQSKYPNIVKPVIEKENQYKKGIKTGLKNQYKRAKGKYIAFCEGDDMWIDPNKLYKEVLILEQNPEVIAVTHDVINFDCGRNKISKHLYKTHKNGILSFKELCAGFAFHQSSLLYRNNEDINNGIPEDLYIFPKIGDFPKSINLYLHGKIYFISEKMSLYRYKSNNESFTNSNVTGSHYLFLQFFENLKKYVNNNDLIIVIDRIDELNIFEYYYRNKIKEIFRNKNLRIIFKKMNFSFKFKVYLKRYFYWLYLIYRKIFKAWHY